MRDRIILSMSDEKLLRSINTQSSFTARTYLRMSVST